MTDRRTPVLSPPERATVWSGTDKRSPVAKAFYTSATWVRDIIVAFVGLVLTLPLILFLAVGMSIYFRCPPFFLQTRVGRNSRGFKVIKIRSLPRSAPSRVAKAETMGLAPPLGRFLRRYKLDELPQLLNILKGDMSLVGPRPIIPEEYGDRSHYERLAIRPGVTGLWQLSRVREERFDHNPEYDLFYLANRSFSFDLWLVWRTVALVLFKKETKIRLAASLWERDSSWRTLVPERAKAIPKRTGPLWSRVWAAAGAGLLLLALAPGMATALWIRADLTGARADLLAASAALKGLQPSRAAAALDLAQPKLERVVGRLSAPAAWPARVIPPFAQNVRAVKALALGAEDLVAAGRQAVKVSTAAPLQGGKLGAVFRDGKFDFTALDSAAAPLGAIRARVAHAERLVAGSPSTALISPVSNARQKALTLISGARRQVDAGEGAAFLLPRILGAKGPKKWIIGAENNAELRGRGGYLGSVGVLRADSGALHLEPFRPVEELPELQLDKVDLPPEYLDYLGLGGGLAWQNLTISPHFPASGPLLLSQLKASANIEAGGVIAIDPVGLSYLLGVTGPVQVAGIPEPLGARNFADWALNRIYFQYKNDNDLRRKQLSNIGEAVWKKVVSFQGFDPTRLAGAVGRALSERHLVLFSSDPAEQAVIAKLGIAGAVNADSGDYLMVLGQNQGENKLDYYVHRQVSYSGAIARDGSLDATLKIAAKSTAPAANKLPDYVGGARSDIQLAAGLARTYYSSFIPARAVLESVSLNGQASSDYETHIEVGKRAVSAYMELLPGESKQMVIRYRVPHAMVRGGYKLTLQNQATAVPDDFKINIQPPKGAEIAGRDGFKGAEALSWHGSPAAVTALDARITIPAWQRLATRLATLLRRPVA